MLQLFIYNIKIYKTFLKGTKTLKTLHGHFYLHEILTTNLRPFNFLGHLSNLNKEHSLDNFYYELKCMKCIRVRSLSSLNFFLFFFNPFNRLFILL